ncbi:hypothetical protein [Rheinheimera sp. 1928-s]|uniref:hypothetical protein n=1 Tax=Rheinheimera sp. 1928-s TaxID=3033803 RepID=UPI002638A4DE|nr:hypothetical protein [Rheinheimera sp. 1928-s]MDF3126498.1 hypothetical protein [Rheinheimera sp. 1928-s]
MFECFKFKQLDGFSPEEARRVITQAKKDAYKTTSFWVWSALLFVFSIGLAVLLMQLPRLLYIEQTIIGMLIQGSGILIAVILHHHLAQKFFLKYLKKQLNKHEV